MQDEQVIAAIVGDRADPTHAERLHALAHRDRIETLVVAPEDLPRRRFHSQTDRGTRCFVALPRDEPLFDGAILLLEADRAIVVRVGEQRWLRIVPRDAAAALELGYLAGNLHWRIRFDAGALAVALDAPRDGYLARLRPLVGDGRVTVDD